MLAPSEPTSLLPATDGVEYVCPTPTIHNFEDESDEPDEDREQKRQQLRRSIDTETDALRNNPDIAQAVHERMLNDCEGDIAQFKQIQKLLATKFVIDHKRDQVTQKVRESDTDAAEQVDPIILVRTVHLPVSFMSA